MASLLSTWSKHVESLPEKYILPPQERPENFTIVSKNIPVIDLGNAGGQSRLDLVQQIMKASEEYGIFQVINHGASEKVMQDAMSLYKEFFDMSVEDKASYYTGHQQIDGIMSRCFLTTGSKNYAKQGFQFWRDTLRHPCHPLDDQHMACWPEKPTRYREVVERYSVEVRKLGLQIWDLICEGLGLKAGILGEDVSPTQVITINNYPPCLDPSMTMGMEGHTDPGLITMIQQDVYGLQAFIGGQWVGLDPLPNAFVVQMCDQMEILSNGKLKSAEHRVVTNSSTGRTSIGSFFSPPHSCVIGPAKELITDDNPPLFETIMYGEYIRKYLEYANEWKDPIVGTALDFFKL